MLTKSESIAELSKALCKAQSVMEGAKKDTSNSFLKSKYASLSSVWDACRKPLSDNGLSVAQTTGTAENGDPQVTTLLMHSSGEWIQDQASFPAKEKTAQGFGSAYTYGRRYGLSAIVGMTLDDDDDGEGAIGRGKISPKDATAKFQTPTGRPVVGANAPTANIVRPPAVATNTSV